MRGKMVIDCCAKALRAWLVQDVDGYRYCSSLTFSIQSVVLPFCDSAIATWLIPFVLVAPCQCLTPAGIQTTSPGRISSDGLSH